MFPRILLKGVVLVAFCRECDKIKKNKRDTYKMEVDILIDKITDCLIDIRTGEEVETEYRMRETPIRLKGYKG